MHFVNPFPFFLDYSFIAVTIIRLLVAYFVLSYSFIILSEKSLIRRGSSKGPTQIIDVRTDTVDQKNEKSTFPQVALCVLGFVSGILLIAGFWTQIGALASIFFFLVLIIAYVASKDRNGRVSDSSIEILFLLLILSICILCLGAGKFAFDLPL